MLKRLGHYFIDNWPAKLLSILFAVGLWAFVINTGFRQATLPEQFPITPRDVAQGLAVANELPAVTVEVRAPTASFQALDPDELLVFVNTAGLTAGQHTLEVKVVADDPNVNILDISPALVEVVLEKSITKSSKINLETEGDLGQGYVADAAELDPQSVDVTGAESTLANIDQVVVRLTLNGETGDVERSITPQALDGDRNLISAVTFNPSVVNVKLPVIQADDAKTVGVEVDTIGSPAQGYFIGEVSVDPSTVTAQGSSKTLTEITVLKTETIDVSGATETIRRTIKIETPDNVRSEPSQVTITIEVRAGTSTDEFTTPPTVVNLGEGLSATVSPPSVTVSLSGPSNLIAEVRTNGVQLSIDAGSKSTGTFSVTLDGTMLNIPEGVTASFSVSSVSVTIE